MSGSPAALPFLQKFLSPDTPPFAVGIAIGEGFCGAYIRELIGRGWRGLLTEAFPSRFQTLQDMYLSSGITCLNVACRGTSGVLSLDDQPVQVCRLTDLLQTGRCPPSFGLLAIGPGQPAMDILGGLNLEQFRPALLILPDDEPDAAVRRENYRQLVGLGFQFCASAVRDSVWRRNDAAAPPPPAESVAAPFSRHSPVLPVAPNLPQPAFSLDRPTLPPDGVIRVGWGGSLCLEGWAFDLPGDVNSTVTIEFVQARTGLARHASATRTMRADVAVFFSDPQLIWSGFRADIALRGWAPGRYAVNLVVLRGGEPSGRAGKTFEVELALHDFELLARSGLAARFLSGSGIEIGALQRHLPLPANCAVKYIDRMPLEQLIVEYPELDGQPLQAPDLVDDGELLLSIADASQDFVIANHFFEHSQDPIRTLLHFARVLAPGGVLFMAVPDKRFTRDIGRPETPYRDLLEGFQTKSYRDTGCLFREWAEQWDGAVGDEISARANELKAANYSIHYNVWTLSGLLEFILGARRDAGVPFEITSVVSSENEVILILTKLGST